MADLRTDYVNDVLDTDVNTERTYNIVDTNGNLIYEGIKIRETTVFATTGDNYGALQINEQNEKINQINNDLTDISANLTASNATVGVENVPFRYGVTDDGKFGYIIEQGGADTVIPFHKKLESENITVQFKSSTGTGTTSFNHSFTYDLKADKQYLLIIVSGNSTDNSTWSCSTTHTDTSDSTWTDVNVTNRHGGRGYSREHIVLIDSDSDHSITMTASGKAYLNYADVHTRCILVELN